MADVPSQGSSGSTPGGQSGGTQGNAGGGKGK